MLSSKLTFSSILIKLNLLLNEPNAFVYLSNITSWVNWSSLAKLKPWILNTQKQLNCTSFLLIKLSPKTLLLITISGPYNLEKGFNSSVSLIYYHYYSYTS
ncbi:hypothetical protein NW733_02710 [Mycoplasmopsis felis]|uniref:hypothetical protein n=1 Tax=Mycoplasmopsis felis TaxID=33923 RepID=UPI0021E002D7|nr:hypothetical protein [Mycoplasmopsis felis]MCU9931605.1 hypothetical protein [Mycoplasmopsis felis]